MRKANHMPSSHALPTGPRQPAPGSDDLGRNPVLPQQTVGVSGQPRPADAGRGSELLHSDAERASAIDLATELPIATTKTAAAKAVSPTEARDRIVMISIALMTLAFGSMLHFQLSVPLMSALAAGVVVCAGALLVHHQIRKNAELARLRSELARYEHNPSLMADTADTAIDPGEGHGSVAANATTHAPNRGSANRPLQTSPHTSPGRRDERRTAASVAASLDDAFATASHRPRPGLAGSTLPEQSYAELAPAAHDIRPPHARPEPRPDDGLRRHPDRSGGQHAPQSRQPTSSSTPAAIATGKPNRDQWAFRPREPQLDPKRGGDDRSHASSMSGSIGESDLERVQRKIKAMADEVNASTAPRRPASPAPLPYDADDATVSGYATPPAHGPNGPTQSGRAQSRPDRAVGDLPGRNLADASDDFAPSSHSRPTPSFDGDRDDLARNMLDDSVDALRSTGRTMRASIDEHHPLPQPSHAVSAASNKTGHASPSPREGATGIDPLTSYQDFTTDPFAIDFDRHAPAPRSMDDGAPEKSHVTSGFFELEIPSTAQRIASTPKPAAPAAAKSAPTAPTSAETQSKSDIPPEPKAAAATVADARSASRRDANIEHDATPVVAASARLTDGMNSSISSDPTDWRARLQPVVSGTAASADNREVARTASPTELEDPFEFSVAPERADATPADHDAASDDDDRVMATNARSRPAASKAVDPRLAAVTSAIENGQLQVLLSPIVGLNTHAVNHYDVAVRLNTVKGLTGEDLDAVLTADNAELRSKLDSERLMRVSALAHRLDSRGKGGSLLTAFASVSLADDHFLETFARIYEERPHISGQLVLTFSQVDVESFSTDAWQALSDMRAFGFRFAIDQLDHLDTNFELLARRGFAFVKMEAEALLGGMPTRDRMVGVAEVCQVIAETGLTLIAADILDNRMRDLLRGFGVEYGQGDVFGGARVVAVDPHRPGGATVAA